MSMSRLKLYAPFIALMLVQGMIMVLAPSIGEPQQAAFGNGDDGVDGGFDEPGFDGGDADGADSNGDGGFDGPELGDTGGNGGDGSADGGQATGAGGGNGDDGSGGDSAQGTGDDGGGSADPQTAQGDTSHCTDDGRQHGFFYHAPPCEPAFEGENGGATYPGVTADEIRVVYFYNAPHPLVDAILPTEDTPEDQKAFMEAAEDFINEHYELYGRRLNLEEVRSNCPTTPPDPARCREAARQIIDSEPFMVIWPGGGLYPTIFDEFARAGIISLGGENFDPAFFNERRPFRYSWSKDGQQIREHLSEYYCKKLAGGKADRSGETIHPEIGARGEVDRRYGIVTPDTPSDVANANALADRIAECERQRPAIFTYELDI
jgi:hypothetical protein